MVVLAYSVVVDVANPVYWSIRPETRPVKLPLGERHAVVPIHAALVAVFPLLGIHQLHVQSVFCRVGFLVESVFCKLVEPIDGLDGKSRVGDAAQNEQRRRPL